MIVNYHMYLGIKKIRVTTLQPVNSTIWTTMSENFARNPLSSLWIIILLRQTDLGIDFGRKLRTNFSFIRRYINFEVTRRWIRTFYFCYVILACVFDYQKKKNENSDRKFAYIPRGIRFQPCLEKTNFARRPPL